LRKRLVDNIRTLEGEDMKEYYQIRGWYKSWEQDTFENGCIGPRSCFDGRDTFTGDTQDKAIEAFARFCGLDGLNDESDAIQRNACDEDGRIDIAVTENDDGCMASDSEIALWKQGKLRLWYAVYTGYLERVNAVKA
jgi:hypothetical protein